VTEVLRNTKDAIADLFMLIACGLHNLRVRYRKRRLKLGHETLFRIKSITLARNFSPYCRKNDKYFHPSPASGEE